MSEDWNPYIAMVSNVPNHCHKVCIVGLNGRIWTKNPKQLLITQEEANAIVKCITAEDESNFMQNGVCVAGVKYPYKRRDANWYYTSNIAGGDLTLYRTKQAILIAHAKDGIGITRGEVKKALEYVGEHIERIGS